MDDITPRRKKLLSLRAAFPRPTSFGISAFGYDLGQAPPFNPDQFGSIGSTAQSPDGPASAPAGDAGGAP